MRIKVFFRKWIILLLAVVGLSVISASQTMAASIVSQVSHDDDDGQQRFANGQVNLDRNQLSLSRIGWQILFSGIRFQNVAIPQGATITNAFIRFTAQNTDSGYLSMRFVGEAADSSDSFSTDNYDLTSRPWTSSSVNWNGVPDWARNRTYDTPDLSSILQEIVNRDGWSSGNSLTLLINGTDFSSLRRAWSHDGKPDAAPELHVTYEGEEPGTAELVAHFPFEFDAGDIAKGNNGSLIGSPDFVPGRICNGISLDGSSDYISVPDSSELDLTPAVTLAAWVRHRTGSGFKNWETILAKGDSAYRLHLNGGCGQPGPQNAFTFGLNGGCGALDVTSSVVPQADTWYHVAATYDGTTATIFVHDANGNLLDQASSTPGATLWTNNYDLWIGANSQQAGRRWNGDIDEVRIYNGALSEAEITALANEVDPCHQIDHFRFERSAATGLTCAASPITVRACADADCSSEYGDPIDATLLPATGWSGGNTKTGFSSGDTFNLRNTAGGTGTLGVTSSTPAANNPVQCFVGGTAASCDMEFFEAGFLLDVPDFESCQDSAQVTIAAVRRDPTTDRCVGIDSFQSVTRTVDFYATRNNPNSGSRNVSLLTDAPSGSHLLNTYAQDGNHPKSGTAVPLEFDTNAESTFRVTYADAGRLGLYAGYVGTGDETDLEMRPINDDTFVAYPDRLTVLATTDGVTPLDSNAPTEATHWPAGEEFQVDIAAICAGGTVTPSFVWEVDLAAAAPNQPGGLGGLTNTIIADGNFINGQANGTTAYSEVGTFTLTAVADDYLGVTGLDIRGDSGEIGRFTPDHFDVVLNAPTFFAANDTFTYLGQPFGYQTPPQITVTAKNKQGATTANYEGAWWRMTEATIGWSYATGDGALDAALATAAVNSTGAGVGTLDFDGTFAMVRSAPIAPFEAEIRLDVNVTDADGIDYGANPVVFGGILDGTGIAFGHDVGGIFTTAQTDKSFYFGRLAIDNAYGPELLDLPVPIRVEYFDGTGFGPHTGDESTLIQDSEITLTNSLGSAVGAGNPIEVAAGISTMGVWGNQPFVAGVGGFTLSAPGAGGTGDIDLTVDLSAYSWLQYDWDNADQANDGPYDDNPTGRASFGLYRGSPRLIYRRESVN